MSNTPTFAIITAGGLLVLFGLLILVLLNTIVVIPNDGYGMVERKWGGRSDRRFAPLSLGNGAGFLPEVLGGGWHMLTPFKYRVHHHKRITIDGIGYLIARVGTALDEGQALGRWPGGMTLDDARGFLENGGQRGPQRRIIRTGTYAPNLALFCVITDRDIYSLALGNADDDAKMQALLRARGGFEPVLVQNDEIGIVTVQDGPALQHGEIVAPTVGTDPSVPAAFHNSFQDIAKFLAAGGRRGRQEQVMTEGTFYINALFATIEMQAKTKVAIGFVAVANSYVGAENPEALTADSGRGRTVARGYKGIWDTPFEPGKYAINPYSMEIEVVPTTNFQLKWIAGLVADTGVGATFDQDLREIPVITRDAFEVLLPLSIVAHISPMSAPHVIQRFSNIQRFVGQTLDPLVSAYFKDATQKRTLLQFIHERQEIQAESLVAMRERLREHRIDIQEVLLGTPKSPPGDDRMERMFGQLRDRQVAEEQKATYASQTLAAEEQKKLARAQAEAEQQPEVTRSELSVRIAENAGRAEVAKQTAAAEGIKVTADAEAYAARTRAEALGGTDALLRQLSLEALVDIARNAKVPIVPAVQLDAGSSGNGTGGLMGALLASAAAAPLTSTAVAPLGARSGE